MWHSMTGAAIAPVSAALDIDLIDGLLYVHNI